MVPWKAFKLAFVPGNEDLRILDIGPNLEAGTFKVAGVELGRVIHYHKFRHAVAFPGVLNGRKLAQHVSLGKDRVFETPHHGQATRRFEPHVKAHWAAGVLIERRGDRGSTQRQHGIVVHDDEVAGRVVHRYALKGAGGVRPGAVYPEFHFGPAFAGWVPIRIRDIAACRACLRVRWRKKFASAARIQAHHGTS